MADRAGAPRLAQLATFTILASCAGPEAVGGNAASPSCPATPTTPATAQSITAPASAPASSPAAIVAPSPNAPAATKPEPPPAVLRDALEAARAAIAAKDMAAADRKLAGADAVAGADAHLAGMVARVRATRWVIVGDFDRAAAAFVAVMPALATRPDLPDEFWAHNTMMMIRAAQGDPAAALAENDQATLAAARGTWDDPDKRASLSLQKDRWHRAYLTRMLAESRSGSAKQALVQYARAALEEYRAIGFPDSIAILDAYFAALDGRRDAALAAARKVDVTKNDDLEDLYLVVVGLEAGGDHAGAEAVRAVMRRAAGPSISHAIMLRWIDLDTKPAKTRGFTPWNAGAR